jgi:hypothetical protein
MGRLHPHADGCVLIGTTGNPTMYAQEWLARTPISQAEQRRTSDTLRTNGSGGSRDLVSNERLYAESAGLPAPQSRRGGRQHQTSNATEQDTTSPKFQARCRVGRPAIVRTYCSKRRSPRIAAATMAVMSPRK